MTTDITVSVDVAAPRPEVWRATTTAVGLAPWWWSDAGDATFDVPNRINQPYRVASRRLGVAVRGWVLERKQPERFVLNWLLEGDEPPAGQEPDHVTYTLEERGFGTRLTVVHQTRQDDPEQLRDAWTKLLASLVKLYDNAH